ncbi:MAG: SDR family oxidoreductase [Lapillicoccus sp.]
MSSISLAQRAGISTRGHFAPRTSIVTGAASGIGAAIAARLVARGSHVVIADLDLDKATAVATQLGNATPVRVDVSDAAAVRDLVSSTVARHGRLDVMVNNAGVAIGGFHEQLEQAQWDLALGVNLGGVINGVNAAYPVMCEQRSGHILNTASLAGLIPAPTMLPYTTTKYAVVGLSTALRAEAASMGVRVSVLCPGFVDTPLLDEIHTGHLEEGEEFISMRKEIRFMQPGLITADEVGDAALRGMERNKAVIAVGSMAHVMWRLNRYLPPVARAIIQVQATGARRVMRQTPPARVQDSPAPSRVGA